MRTLSGMNGTAPAISCVLGGVRRVRTLSTGCAGGASAPASAATQSTTPTTPSAFSVYLRCLPREQEAEHHDEGALGRSRGEAG